MPPPRTDGRARICLPEVERLLREGGTDEEWEDLELPELHHGQYIRRNPQLAETTFLRFQYHTHHYIYFSEV